MSTVDDLFSRVPNWLLRPLPVNATVDPSILTRIDTLATQLPDSLGELSRGLNNLIGLRAYDGAVNRASAHVWLACKMIASHPVSRFRTDLLIFASNFMVPEAVGRLLRQFIRHPDPQTRRAARRTMARGGGYREVALPSDDEKPWDTTGWLRGTESNRLFGHAAGARVQQRWKVPELKTVGDLRELLGIRSPQQLGYLLLATDENGGPYHRFTVSKRDGTARQISAPSKGLLYFQRMILAKILNAVSPHPAAHGFVRGRSIVTNAAPHQGAGVIVKFDLTDFFPTIHYYRVMGLFASLGYDVGDAKFSTSDSSRQVAPTLARLTVFTTSSRTWGEGVLPQGAPTSPAISNLVCRTLDTRLTGLANALGGTYTRYADDLTFSFAEVPRELGRFRWWVNQICHQEGFLVNESKFRVIRSSQRQCVTGLVVNDTLHVPRTERRRLRAILHNCKKHGLESQLRDNPALLDYLQGMASYIHMVDPEEGTRLLAEVRALQDS